MPRIFINPTYQSADRADGGIRRVTEALARHLPEYGWQPTYGPEDCDLIMNHGTLLCERPGIPMIAACHGLYWLGYDWPLWSEDANRRVIDVAVRADAITVPSKWVAKPIQRGLLRNPTVIYHGVDTNEWTPPDDGCRPFVIWNKARKDPVSDPGDMQKLAAMLPNIPFITTIGEPDTNIRVIGVQNVGAMKEILRHSRVYLATARETFGIGTLEALACGIPVVGWNYGGQHEIVKHEETGLLVPHGDYGALADALQKVWNDREQYATAARRDAIARWQWHDKVAQYAELFDLVLQRRQAQKNNPKVSIIVTCYNLASFLPDSLKSITELAFNDWECIIVDDASTDNTPDVVRGWLQDIRFSYIRNPENLGLSASRNRGAEQSKGQYLLFLDADDMLDRAGLQDLVDTLDNNTEVHVAYGSLDTIQEDGSNRRRNPWPSGHFDWRAQIAHLNQLPYSSLMRRDVFESVGGYRARDWRAEDSSFWIRASSHGFRISRVTDRPVLVYRWRAESKSIRERNKYPDRDGDWTSWFPWRLGAKNGEEGQSLMTSLVSPNALVVPAGAQGDPPAPHISWPVRHFAEPLVSVIIPVGPGHDQYVIDALDSLAAQTFPEWEAVVVNDTGRPLNTPGHPYAKVIETDVEGSGAGKARNLGIKYSEAPLLFFLDADDWLRPDALEKMIDRYARDGGYIYSDCVGISDNESSKVYASSAGVGWTVFSEDYDPESVWYIQAAPYSRQDFAKRGYTENLPGAHSVSILVARVDIDVVGGFDEGLAFWEDWEIMLKFVQSGLCGQHIAEPLLSYRLKTGRRRRASKDVEDQLRKILRDKYETSLDKVGDMCNCGGGGQTLQQKAQAALSPIQTAAQRSASTPRNPASGVNLPGADTVPGFMEAGVRYFEYIGRKSAPVPYVGRATGKVYRASLDPLHKIIEVDPTDADYFLSSREFQEVRRVDNAPEEAATVQW